MNNIVKLIQFLENRGLLLKRTIEKIINQNEVFLGLFTRVGIPLMKNVLTL